MARAFSSPRSPDIPTPTRINPIWDTEEHARVSFKSMENRASTAPITMVHTPRIRIRLPQPLSHRKR